MFIVTEYAALNVSGLVFLTSMENSIRLKWVNLMLAWLDHFLLEWVQLNQILLTFHPCMASVAETLTMLKIWPAETS